MDQVTSEEIRQQQADRKFDRNLKIAAGIISVLGVAATTIMTIMESEKKVRQTLKTRRSRTLKGGKKKPKSLKAPPKKKMAKFKPIISESQLLLLEKRAEKVLDRAQQLKEEAANGELSIPRPEK